jgi:hypothetical protein
LVLCIALLVSTLPDRLFIIPTPLQGCNPTKRKTPLSSGKTKTTMTTGTTFYDLTKTIKTPLLR